MNSIMPYASQMPSSIRYQMTQDANNIFSILCLSFFFAYMGYKILMDYNNSKNQMEDRMKIIEGHMEAIEENAQYINNEIVNNSETLKVLRDEIGIAREQILVLYKYASEFDNDWHSDSWKEQFAKAMDSAHKSQSD